MSQLISKNYNSIYDNQKLIVALIKNGYEKDLTFIILCGSADSDRIKFMLNNFHILINIIIKGICIACQRRYWEHCDVIIEHFKNDAFVDILKICVEISSDIEDVTYQFLIDIDVILCRRLLIRKDFGNAKRIIELCNIDAYVDILKIFVENSSDIEDDTNQFSIDVIVCHQLFIKNDFVNANRIIELFNVDIRKLIDIALNESHINQLFKLELNQSFENTIVFVNYVYHIFNEYKNTPYNDDLADDTVEYSELLKELCNQLKKQVLRKLDKIIYYEEVCSKSNLIQFKNSDLGNCVLFDYNVFSKVICGFF